MGFYFINSAENKLFYCCTTLLKAFYSEVKTIFNYSPAPYLTSSFMIEFAVSWIILIESLNSDEDRNVSCYFLRIIFIYKDDLCCICYFIRTPNMLTECSGFLWINFNLRNKSILLCRVLNLLQIEFPSIAPVFRQVCEGRLEIRDNIWIDVSGGRLDYDHEAFDVSLQCIGKF